MSSVYVGLVILAAVLDVSFRKIPNYINFTLLILGVLNAIIKSGVYEGFSSLLAVGTTLLVLLLPFALGVYRGGDVKLCMGMSAWLGIEKCLWVVGLGILGGGGLGTRRGGEGWAGRFPMCQYGIHELGVFESF